MPPYCPICGASDCFHARVVCEANQIVSTTHHGPISEILTHGAFHGDLRGVFELSREEYEISAVHLNTALIFQGVYRGIITEIDTFPDGRVRIHTVMTESEARQRETMRERSERSAPEETASRVPVPLHHITIGGRAMSPGENRDMRMNQMTAQDWNAPISIRLSVMLAHPEIDFSKGTDAYNDLKTGKFKEEQHALP